MSDAAARGSLSYILPRLNRNEEAEESWEVLDTKPVGKGAQALRWIVWVSRHKFVNLCYYEYHCRHVSISRSVSTLLSLD